MENSEIPLIGLDQWLISTPSAPQSIDLLKIDVEGMELDVLRSGADLIEKFRPIIVFELSHQPGDEALLSELERFFVPRGYTFLVNLHGRNSRTDEFRLGRLGELHKRELIGAGTIDVIAIQPGSSRFPERIGRKAFNDSFLPYTTPQGSASNRRRSFAGGQLYLRGVRLPDSPVAEGGSTRGGRLIGGEVRNLIRKAVSRATRRIAREVWRQEPPPARNQYEAIALLAMPVRLSQPFCGRTQSILAKRRRRRPG